MVAHAGSVVHMFREDAGDFVAGCRWRFMKVACYLEIQRVISVFCCSREVEVPSDVFYCLYF